MNLRSPSRLALASIAALAIVIVSYQNCSVRRLSGAGAAGALSSNSSGSGSSAGTGGSTGTSAGGDTSSGGGGGGAASSCMIDPDVSAIITGITGQPAIRTGLASISRVNQNGFQQTSLSLVYMSSCASKTDLTTAQRCPSGTPTCDASKTNFTIAISITCSGDITANSCTNFTGNPSYDLSVAANAANVGKISISVINQKANNNCAADTYFMPYLNAKSGRVSLSLPTSFADGNTATVTLANVKLEKGGNSTTDSVTVNGTFKAEIVTTPACTN